jgi:hypothetical protein
MPTPHLRPAAVPVTSRSQSGRWCATGCWGGTYTGTVVRLDGRSVFVAWHGTAVEDELDIDDVVPWPDAPAELGDWRGGVGVLDGDGYRVDPVGGEQ